VAPDELYDEHVAKHPSAAKPRRTALIASLVVGIVMVGFIAVLAVSDTGPRAAKNNMVGQAAPGVSGVTLDGNAFDLDDYRGRWVLVNFFADWCPPCRVEHPELVKFHEAHAARGDIEIVSVAFQNSKEDVQAFFDENGGEWPVLADDVNHLAIAWGVTKLPESFLISPQGVVAYKFISSVTQEDLESVLSEARGRPVENAATSSPSSLALASILNQSGLLQ